MFKKLMFMFNEHYMNHKLYCDISFLFKDYSSYKIY